MAQAPDQKPASSRSFVSSLGTLALALMLLAFGFWAGRTFETLWPSGSVPASPASVAVATRPPSTLPTPVSPSPSLSPTPSPMASPAPSPVATITPSPAAARSVTPGRAPARAGRRGTARGKPPAGGERVESAASAPPAPLELVAGGRPFVFGTSVVESLKQAGQELRGFETSGIGLKRAPEVPGRIDFEVDPARVKAGDRYAVKVYLVNEGHKSIAIHALSVALTADGRRSARAMPPRSQSVPPRQRALLAELPGVWQESVADWGLEVAVTSKRQDRYTNTLNWK